ncbi:MAG: hypothetical protein ACYC27_04905 [Armatimonadota bacterium]
MKLLKTIILLLAIIVFSTSFVNAQNIQKQPDKIVGIYVHQHWPYNHPYAARTWTLSDWRGYADGMKKLGYNTFLIWPMLETMPNPLTSSDKASIDKIRKVIDMLHNEFQMRVHIIICPNVIADDAEAGKATFEKRHFFYTDLRVNPGDPQAVSAMMKWRERLISPLSKADGFVIIDSDPGGYPGSNNEEFVNLLAEHRKIFDKLRPGIELFYWMHAGWPAYCRFYETGDLKWGPPEEFRDAISKLNRINPEPWGMANGLRYAQDLGLESRVVGYNYGAIEGEPSFPFTNFGGSAAYDSGKDSAPRGVIGNAQTHCVQLPNTFAFSRGAKELPLTESDYVQFANDLIPGKGRLIVDAWKAMSGDNTSTMRKSANDLEPLTKVKLQTGNLRGLLFGSPKRFITDLIMQLRMKAASNDFVTESRNDNDIRKSYKEFVKAAETWQKQHGYECAWYWPGLHEALRSLNSPVLNSAFDMKNDGKTPFDRVHIDLQNMETLTSRLIKAMKEAIPSIESREYKKAVSSLVTKDGETHSLRNANWQGDSLTSGGLDTGLSGDRSALCASADNSEGFTQSASMPLNLANDYSGEETVKLTIGYRRNTLQTSRGTVLWDGKPVLVCTPRLNEEKLDTVSVTLPGKLFKSGKHILEIQAMNEISTSPDFFEIDAIQISSE